MNQAVFGRFPASLIHEQDVLPSIAASLSTPYASSHTLEIRAAAPNARYGGIFTFCSPGLSRLAMPTALFTAHGCCESIGSGRIGRKLAVGNTSEKAGPLKMLLTGRPQSQTTLP